ncbi:very short patch repair endonuclease [Salipiger abyssi]|uniref:very short patch repair endonuclease n=1 Tax=Salipiger abyssi TaxID=1250539 RepID=UPI0040591029
MADIVSPDVRSRMMSGIRRRDTKPELAVRSALHRDGYRFRVDVSDLPGSPDIVLAKWNTAIFIHGCFWHRHAGCARATNPRTHAETWQEKFQRNIERDEKATSALLAKGWRVALIWECSLGRKYLDDTMAALKQFISGSQDVRQMEWPETPVFPLSPTTKT